MPEPIVMMSTGARIITSHFRIGDRARHCNAVNVGVVTISRLRLTT